MRSNGMSIDHIVIAEQLLGERHTEALYKARKAGASRVVREPVIRFFEGLSDLRFTAMAAGLVFIVICAFRELIMWGEELADGSPIDAEYDAMEVAVGVALSAFAVWILGSVVRHVDGPTHEDPQLCKHYFENLKKIISDSHPHKADILNPPAGNVDACERFYAFHSQMLQHLLVVKKNPRATLYVLTALRRRIQHTGMDLTTFEAQLGYDNELLAWDSDDAQSIHSSALRGMLDDLRSDDADAPSVSGLSDIEASLDEEGSGLDDLGSEAAALAATAADRQHRQAIIQRLITRRLTGGAAQLAAIQAAPAGEVDSLVAAGAYADRAINPAEISARPGRGSFIRRMQENLVGEHSPAFVSHLNAALHGVGPGGVVTNPTPALVATFLATVPLPTQPMPDDESVEGASEDGHSAATPSVASSMQNGMRRRRVVDHFNLNLHQGESVELPTAAHPHALVRFMDVAGRDARVGPIKGFQQPHLGQLRYHRGYLAEYLIADVGHSMRNLTQKQLQPRLETLGTWFHWGRQALHITQLDRDAYDRGRFMATAIKRLLKYQGPFETDIPGQVQEQTLFDRARLFASLLRTVDKLDDWRHWSAIDAVEQHVFSQLSVDHQVQFIFTLMSGPPYTQLLARAFIHDSGQRPMDGGASQQVHPGFSHDQLNKFYKAYLAFMAQPIEGEMAEQRTLRNVLITEQLVFLTDGCQDSEQQDRRMMDYCRQHTQKPLRMLLALCQTLASSFEVHLLALKTEDGFEVDVDNLKQFVGAHTQHDDLMVLLDGVDFSGDDVIQVIQQRLTEIQVGLSGGGLDASNLAAAQRLEARQLIFSARLVTAYRAALNRAMVLFGMLRDDVQRQLALQAINQTNPDQALLFFQCEDEEAFAQLRMLLPLQSDLRLLSVLLQPPLPARHRHTWKVLIRLWQHHADYESDIVDFLTDHVDVMLNEPSFRLMFDVADIAFEDTAARQQFAFIILKTINQSTVTTLDKGCAIDAFLKLGYQGQTVFELIKTFKSCFSGADDKAKNFDHILQRLFAYRHRALSRQATADDVISLLGVDLAGLKDVIRHQATMDKQERVMTRCALSAWITADRPRGSRHIFHTIDTFKSLCQLDDAHEHGILSVDSSQRFDCRQWLVSTVLSALITTSDTTKYPAIIALLSAFGAAYPTKFGVDAFSVVRVFETCKRVLGQHEDRVIRGLVQHDARFLWIYVRSFVVDPADILATAGEDDVGLPTVAFEDNAKALYDWLPSNQSSNQNSYEQILSQLIWFPKRLSPREDTSADLGYMLTALMRHDKNNGYRKSMSLMRLQAIYLEAKVGPRLDAARLADCPAIYRQSLIDYIQQETFQCLRELEQAFQVALCRPDEVLDDDAAIQVYWSDYIALASVSSDLPGQVGCCPIVQRASFMTWLRMQIKERGQLEIAMATGTEVADENFAGVFTDFANQMNSYKLTSAESAQIPVCPVNLRPHFDAFKARFYPGFQWPGQDRDLRNKVWQQFLYGVMTLNWFSKPWLEPGDRPQMLCDTLGQIEASLHVLATAESSPNLSAQRSRCMQLVELLYPVYEQAISTAPESQPGQELVQDQFASAEFTADEQAAAQRVLFVLLKLPKPTDEQDKQAILSVAIKLAHLCLSSNVLTDNRFKTFYRDIMPRFMAYLRPLNFQHRDDAALLSDVWARLPNSLQPVSHPDDVDDRPHVSVNTRVKQCLSLAYVCWRYHLYVRTGSWSKHMNGLLSCLGTARSYTLLAAECVQQANRGFCQLPTDLGQSLNTSPACRNWIREHLAIAVNPPRLVLDLDAAERGTAVTERAPLLGPGGGIN